MEELDCSAFLDADETAEIEKMDQDLGFLMSFDGI